jgi:predicted membrane protein
MFEFLGGLGGLGDQNVLLFFAVFIVFTILAFKLVKFLFKTFLIGLVAAMFPVVGSLVFGLSIPINLYNMIWFAVTGMGLFIAYSAIRMGWKFVRLALSPLKLFRRKGGSKKEAKEVKEDKEKKKEAPKANEEQKTGE